MNLTNDAGTVLAYIKSIKIQKSKAAWMDADEAAFNAARRIVDELEKQAREAGDDEPVVYRLEPPERVVQLRQFAVDAGWFEVPGGLYETLRMIDTATGNHLVVYHGRKGIKAVANIGHRAAQKLLNQFVKARPR